jgi:general secretion pathway protein D
VVKIKSIFLACIIATGLFAKNECEDKMFSQLNAAKGTTVYQLLDQMSSYCSFSIVVKDDEAERILQKGLGNTNLKNFTINDILSFLLTDNNLEYEFKNGILKVSYYVSKTFNVDYINSDRKANGNSGVTLGGGGVASGASFTATTNSGASSSTANGGSSSSSAGSMIITEDNFDFWTKLQSELSSIISLNPGSYFPASNKNLDINTTSGGSQNVIVNRVAGLVTVIGSKEQVAKAEKYINSLMQRLHQQVMIDVKILSVSLIKANTTGIDWSQIYSLQNIKMGYGKVGVNNGGYISTSGSSPTFSGTTYSGSSTTAGTTGSTGNLAGGIMGFQGASYFSLDAAININDVIKFLKTQGDVKSISNPKVLTLNNQAALISSGDQIFYQRVSSTSTTGSTTGTVSNGTIVESIFAGVSLDITPEILDDGSIILRINPTISSCLSSAQCQPSTSKIPDIKGQPPDLSKRQISSVVKARDGDKVIIGGLIRDDNDTASTQLPLLGDIPIIGYLFKQEAVKKTVSELVIIITPYIVKKEKQITLKELGFSYDETK